MRGRPSATSPKSQEILAVLRRHPAGIMSGAVAKEVGLTGDYCVTLLRALRDAGLAGTNHHGAGAVWAASEYLEAIRTEREQKTAAEREAIARYWREQQKRKDAAQAEEQWIATWADRPVVHSRISANDAPRIQRSKPYSVFTLAA